MSSSAFARRVGLLALLGLFVSMVVLAPVSLGGNTTWVKTSGASMEPAFRTGDLVLVRPAETYRVGDVVAYRSAELAGTTVLHRVIDTAAGRLTTQGDNNAWTDPDHPRSAEVLGSVTIHVPGGATMLSTLTSPLVLGGAVVILAVAGALGLGQRRRRRRTAGHPPTGRRRAALGGGTSRPAPDWVWGTALAALAVAALSFSRPTQVEGPPGDNPAHVAEITYTAPTEVRSIYPDGEVRTGDPVFPDVTPFIDVRMEYALEGDVGSPAGSIRAAALIETSNGWTRRVPLTPVGEAQHAVASAHTVRLALGQLRDMVSRAEQAAGTSFGTPTIDVVFTVDTAVTGGAATFEPALRLIMDETQVRPESELEDGVVRVEDPAGTDPTGLVPNKVGALGWEVPVTALRLVALLLAGATLVLAALMLARGPSPRAARVFRGRLIEARAYEAPEGNVVEVTHASALAEVAERHDTVVIAAADAFFVVTQGPVFRYGPHEVPREQSVPA